AAGSGPMGFRYSGMTLGGKLSLAYLAFSSILLVIGGISSEWVLIVFGFPLLYAPWVYGQVFGEIGQLQPMRGLLLLATLWVGNAYVWGYTVALIVRWVRSWSKLTQDTDTGNLPAK